MEPLIGPYHEDSRFDVVYLNCKRRVMASMFGFMVCLDWPYVWRLHRYKIVYRLYTDRSVLEKEMETGAVERRRVQILRVARRSDVHSVQSSICVDANVSSRHERKVFTGWERGGISEVALLRFNGERMRRLGP
jgi:hypothetical protein